MDPFTRVEVEVDLNNHKIIHWEINPSFAPGVPMDFYVERARSGGDWTRIGGPITDDCYFIDPTKQNWAKDRDTFYRVYFKHKRKGYFSEPAHMGVKFQNKHDWLIARDIVRKEYLDIKKYGGIRGVFLRRRKWGELCPECLDWDTNEQVIEFCTTCLGTRFVGGYYSPMEMWIKRESLPGHGKSQHKQGLGTGEPGTKWKGKVVAYPWIDTLDLWVDTRTNERYTIHDVRNKVEYQGIPLLYNVELRLEAKANANIIYTPEMNEKLQEDPRPQGTDNGWRPDLDLDF